MLVRRTISGERRSTPHRNKFKCKLCGTIRLVSYSSAKNNPATSTASYVVLRIFVAHFYFSVLLLPPIELLRVRFVEILSDVALATALYDFSLIK